MMLFGKRKTAKANIPTEEDIKNIEMELNALMKKQRDIDYSLTGMRNSSPNVSDKELEDELEELMRQHGKSRGGDRLTQLRAMLTNSIQTIKALDKGPITPEISQSRMRLLETAKRLSAEIERLKKGARRTKRKRATRRRRALQSS